MSYQDQEGDLRRLQEILDTVGKAIGHELLLDYDGDGVADPILDNGHGLPEMSLRGGFVVWSYGDEHFTIVCPRLPGQETETSVDVRGLNFAARYVLKMLL